jgi:O-antigen ligase
MAETPLEAPRAGSAAPSRRADWRAALLAGVEWALLAGALATWTASQGYRPTMVYGSGLLTASWLARWARTGQLTRRTPFDWVLGLFAVSALAGLWAAPNLGLALPRWYLFLGAIGLFYALANSAGASRKLAALGLAGLAAALGVYFVTQHPWAQASVKLEAVRALGVRLNQLVPDLGQYKPHPNVVASILGVMTPVAAALAVSGWRQWRDTRGGWMLAQAAVASGCVLVILPALAMTESRATWVGLAAALALAGWWWAARAGGDRRAAIFWAGAAAAGVVAAAVATWQPDLLVRAFGVLPGPGNTATTRLALFGQVWRLAQDAPFTGAGLGAFPGLYSTFVLDIPFLSLTHAHNSYLNVLLEQGWAGLAGLVLAVAVGGAAATRALTAKGAAQDPLLAAGAAGLAVVAVQGLADATLVASRAIIFLWVPAALVASALPSTSAAQAAPAGRRVWGWAGVGVAAAVVVAGLIWQRPLRAAWQANLGVVAYDRAALEGWPRNVWSEPAEAAALAAAGPPLEAALRLDEGNRAAHLRLGLERRMAQDFEGAAAHLAAALAADPGQRGSVKALGYTYTWQGNLDAARPLLEQIPEAHTELDTYEWWWGTQGRPDLAGLARQMRGLLRP